MSQTHIERCLIDVMHGTVNTGQNYISDVMKENDGHVVGNKEQAPRQTN
jgi:hypothetical protein